jgi:hypothetical protein
MSQLKSTVPANGAGNTRTHVVCVTRGGVVHVPLAEKFDQLYFTGRLDAPAFAYALTPTLPVVNVVSLPVTAQLEGSLLPSSHTLACSVPADMVDLITSTSLATVEYVTPVETAAATVYMTPATCL